MIKTTFNCCPHGHEDDSYGSCTICREYVPHTDEDSLPVAWPCATEREARYHRHINEQNEIITGLVGDFTAAEAEITRLHAALNKYGRHSRQCRANSGDEPDCDCGLTAALGKINE